MTPEIVKFNVTREEDDLAVKIVARAVKLAERVLPGSPINAQSLHMDICACIAQGCPLRLEELLAADTAEFCHDVWGIKNHMDRTTGKLTGHFHPRFAKD